MVGVTDAVNPLVLSMLTSPRSLVVACAVAGVYPTMVAFFSPATVGEVPNDVVVL